MWGYEQSDINEKVHLRFVDFELNLKSGTQNLMVVGKQVVFFIKYN